MSLDLRKPVGLALGSGAARGWSHIGVLRALEERGISPEIVCGTSVGAVVGAFYAAGQLDSFEDWAGSLEWRDVVGYLDPTLRGGFIKARRLFDAIAARMPDQDISTLGRAYAAVATDLATGQEVWLREGSVHKAARASMALPGLITPERIDDRWLVDGGLVNPVPVSVCRALGAGSVIAVDLNSTLLGRRLHMPLSSVEPGIDAGGLTQADALEDAEEEEASPIDLLLPPDVGDEEDGAEAVLPRQRFFETMQEMAIDLFGRFSREGNGDRPPDLPSLYEVVTNSINIMQVRIGRSRMAGDPPDVLVLPKLDDFALLDFNRAEEAIEAGRRAVAVAFDRA